MKERFRLKHPKGPIKVKYWIDRTQNKYKYWEADALKISQEIIDITERYADMGINLTNRQCYYQLVGNDLIPNAQEVYKKVCNLITDLRYAGRIDWDTIEDKGRKASRPGEWDSISDIIRSATKQFRLPRWADQETYVEMYCEKEAGVSVLQPIAEKYHVYFGFNKGYSSASAMYKLAKRLGNELFNGKKVVVLYFGDHDPSGLDMIRDIRDRIKEFVVGSREFLDQYHDMPLSYRKKLEDTYREVGEEDEEIVTLCAENEFAEKSFKNFFQVIPVALTKEQIDQYGPPPNPAKIKDPRANWYIKKHGPVSWELDSIDAIKLREIAEEAVLDHIDMGKYNAIIDKEKEQVKSLREFGERMDREEDDRE